MSTMGARITREQRQGDSSLCLCETTGAKPIRPVLIDQLSYESHVVLNFVGGIDADQTDPLNALRLTGVAHVAALDRHYCVINPTPPMLK